MTSFWIVYRVVPLNHFEVTTPDGMVHQVDFSSSGIVAVCPIFESRAAAVARFPHARPEEVREVQVEIGEPDGGWN